MNKVILKGNLTKEVELKISQTQTNKEYVRFDLAINKYVKQQDNTFKTVVSYLPCIAFSHNAIKLDNQAQKGSAILIEGEINYKNEKQIDGTFKTYFSVLVEKLEVLTNKKERQQGVVSRESQPTNFNEDDSILWEE